MMNDDVYLLETPKEILMTVWLILPWGRGILMSSGNPIRIS